MANKNHLINKYDEFSYRYINGELKLTKNKRHENDEIVNAMYAMYCLPRSLEYIGRKYGLKRQTIYALLKQWGYSLRSKKMLGLQVLDNINFSKITGNEFLRGTVNKKRIYMHHYVWQKYKGDIPYKHCVYHKDRNRSNNNIENLILIPKDKMSSKFNLDEYIKSIDKS